MFGLFVAQVVASIICSIPLLILEWSLQSHSFWWGWIKYLRMPADVLDRCIEGMEKRWQTIRQSFFL